VDSVRDKIIVHASVAVPLFGNINADVLYNFQKGTSVAYIPFLGLCQSAPGNATLNLQDVITNTYTKEGNITEYSG
jgi:hypothetical protein